MKALLIVLGGILAVFLLGWALTANKLALQSVFAPKFEEVRRSTFEQSTAYNQGMIQELRAMQYEYAKASPEQKAALAGIIRHRSNAYDMSKLPPDLADFIKELN